QDHSCCSGRPQAPPAVRVRCAALRSFRARRPSFDRTRSLMRVTCRLSATLILIAGLAIPAAAQQTGTVTGTLTNSLSGDPIPNALVTLEAPTFSRQVRSGADGKFTVANVPAGAYHLIIRADGYLPSRTEVTVSTG